MESINLDNINEIVEFSLNEIALEGLEGCKLTDLFELLYKSASLCISVLNESSQTHSTRIYNLFASIKKSNDIEIKNFIWKLIASQNCISFCILNKTLSNNASIPTTSAAAAANKTKPTKTNEQSKIINHNENRGYCADYFKRSYLSATNIRNDNGIKSLKECLNEYGPSLILVANQQLRNKTLCPTYKFLDFECLNDLEYCILEKIAKSRYDGIYTTSTGNEEGLAKIFNLTSKQLHYTLVQLEIHGLIRKQVLKSEKKRSIIYLIKYSFRNKSYLENMCEYLSTITQSSENNYSDSFVNLKKRFHFTNKQFKTLVHNGEKQQIFKRFIVSYTHKIKKSNSKSILKTKQARMLKLTDTYFKTLKQQQQDDLNETNNEDELLAEEDDNDAEDDANSNKNDSLIESIGSEQANTLPLYSQILDRIESSGKEGISLKNLGHIFGFDFYKSRRLGSNLQTNSEIVTIMKETCHGKAKYQNLVLRKFLKLNTANGLPSVSNENSQIADETVHDIATSITIEPLTEIQAISIDEPELVLIKRDNQPTKTIQALMSDRSTARKRIILNYLEKNKICTKYEINKEIRRIEAEQALKGCIDSKTTKRMLIAMEKEKKLHIFTVNLKNVSYMGVRSFDISEQDPIYTNYCLTFKRTFDTVDLKFKTEKIEIDEDLEATNTTISEKSENQKDTSSCIDIEDTEQKSFQLTRTYINSIVSQLKFSSNYSKAYALVPKFQKAIILHRLLQYLLYFYDGAKQDSNSDWLALNEQPCDIASHLDKEVVDSVILPGVDKTFQPLNPSKTVNWSTFIPPITKSANKSSAENNCLFVGEILSHMPVSIFCSIIVINHHVPGLVALLKHPQKRHMLVRDLPPSLIAPLIFERRYLRRILSNLQILACLGLITFVESPCNTNQAVNRDVQSQLVYVHKQAAFYDTSINNAKDWTELKLINEYNITENEKLSNNDQIVKYEKCYFEFNRSDDVVNYWRKLLHVSMNTYKLNVNRYLHENKRLRQELLCKILPKLKLNEINDLWTIEKFGDHMGPGGYSSQLFLNSFKNWMLPSNVVSASGNTESGRKSNKKSYKDEPAITKEADLTTATFSELALNFPFGIFCSISNYGGATKRKTKQKQKSSSDSEEIQTDEQPKEPLAKKRIKHTIKKKTNPAQPSSIDQTKTENEQSKKTLKLIKAKYLIDRAKVYKLNSTATSNSQMMMPTTSQQASSASIDKQSFITNNERRAIWQPDEDELILLIKVASLYFLPEEKSIPFKLISDVMNQLVPNKCTDKKLSSFGRRIKILLKSNMNILFVANKLELCKQDKETELNYKEARREIKRNLVDKHQVDLYTKFVKDIKEKFLKKKIYTPAEPADDETEKKSNKFELPATMKEFKEKFIINNTSKDILLKNQPFNFQQPTTDYEITCNTLHSAIHSSILINDKNPRITESFNLFDKYSDQLLTDVIYKMSRVHKIIAPTKCSELKKKNVTAFSKHIGKAYHISQRYQYKWTNNISASILNETNKFKNDLKMFNLKKQSTDEMFDCTDKDEVGMTSFLAHTIENSDLQVQIDVPNRIWVSKLI